MPPIIPPTASLIMLEYISISPAQERASHNPRWGSFKFTKFILSIIVTCHVWQCDTRAVVTISVTWTSEEGVTAVMSGGIVTEAAASHITPSHPRYEELIVVTLWRAASWHMTGGAVMERGHSIILRKYFWPKYCILMVLVSIVTSSNMKRTSPAHLSWSIENKEKRSEIVY